MSNIKIAVIGGDGRQAAVASVLASHGLECAVFAVGDGDIGGACRCTALTGAVTNAAAVVLPLPVSRDGEHLNAPFYKEKLRLDNINSAVPQNVPFLAGMANSAHFGARPVYDYYAKESLQLLNTVPTAEGAIAIAMETLPTTLHGTKCLITGYGRVGKTLARMLCGLGVRVSVATRNPAERAHCDIAGLEAVEYSTLTDRVGEFGLIYNTVPALLFTETVLDRVRPDTPIIDLATHPGGVDSAAAKTKGVNVLWALGLPGKVAPVTAGHYIAKTVIAILKEENII